MSTFEKQLERKLELYRRKNADYSGGLGAYFNFEHTAALIAPMVAPGINPVDVVFIVMEGIKLSRLIALKRSGQTPNNESVLDSHTDFANYAEIWEAYETDRLKKAE
jgi:hypothetical protein